MPAAGERQDEALLTLSGGIDSTYALYKLLGEGRKLTVLHVDLVSHEGRSRFEADAVRKINGWLRGRGYRFELLNCRWSYGDLGWITRDIEIVRFAAGVALAAPKRQHISTVIASGIAEDPVLSDSEVARIRSILESAARRPLEIERPIRHMSKAEVIADMPPELLRMCWYCRRPRNGRPCGECRTCRHVEDARARPAVSSGGTSAGRRPRPAGPEGGPSDGRVRPVTGHVCETCGFVAKSPGGLAAHARKHDS